jgi:hypothetical protein
VRKTAYHIHSGAKFKFDCADLDFVPLVYLERGRRTSLAALLTLSLPLQFIAGGRTEEFKFIAVYIRLASSTRLALTRYCARKEPAETPAVRRRNRLLKQCGGGQIYY